MALNEYKRATDENNLVQDKNVEVTDLLYIPLAASFAELSIGAGQADKPGAVSAYMDGADVKIAVYRGDGAWSRAGSSVAYKRDDSLAYGANLSQLTAAFPAAGIGDVLYSETSFQRWEKIAEGEWMQSGFEKVVR